MDQPKLDDAEALQILWDSAEALARDSRRQADAAARLAHTARRFVQTVVQGAPDDPRHLLSELGSVLEVYGAVRADCQGLEEATEALGFTFVPAPSSHPLVQTQAMHALVQRLLARGVVLGVTPPLT